MANYITRMTVDLLIKNEESRDDMMLTVRYIHDFEMALFSIPKTQYYDALFNGKLSSIKTLDRIWRKAQMDNPSLLHNIQLEISLYQHQHREFWLILADFLTIFLRVPQLF